MVHQSLTSVAITFSYVELYVQALYTGTDRKRNASLSLSPHIQFSFIYAQQNTAHFKVL